MNELSAEKQAQIISAICEGASIRSTARQAEVSKNTVSRLIKLVAIAVERYQDEAFRNLDIHRVEADEIWAFCGSKERNIPKDHLFDPNYGDVWTWVAIDADTKLIPSWLVGDRIQADCYDFLADLQSRIRPGNRIQLTTDGHRQYLAVVENLWGAGIDYAVVLKEYGGGNEDHKYSPATCTSIEKRRISGRPNPGLISTSYVERQNLTMRMNSRRYTRLTNGFSRKVANHARATALHFAYYNLVRPHQTLTKAAGRKTTPAMAAGVEKYPWSVRDLIGLLDRYEAAA